MNSRPPGTVGTLTVAIVVSHSLRRQMSCHHLFSPPPVPTAPVNHNNPNGKPQVEQPKWHHQIRFPDLIETKQAHPETGVGCLVQCSVAAGHALRGKSACHLFSLFRDHARGNHAYNFIGVAQPAEIAMSVHIVIFGQLHLSNGTVSVDTGAADVLMSVFIRDRLHICS